MKEVSKREWDRTYEILRKRSQNFVSGGLSDTQMPLSGVRGRKRWLPKDEVAELFHFITVPCNEIDEDVTAVCLAVTSSSNGEEKYFIGVHKVGECPYKEDDPDFGRFPSWWDYWNE